MQQLAFHTDMAAALRRIFRRRRHVADPAAEPVTEPVTEPVAIPVAIPVADPVAEPVTWICCPCTNPDEKQFPVVHLGDTLRGEFELPTARDMLSGCCFHTLDRSRSRLS